MGEFMKSVKKKRLVAFLAVIMAVCTASSAYATTQDEIDDKTSQQQTLQEEQQKLQDSIAAAKDDKEKQQKISDDLKVQIADIESQVDDVTTAITDISQQIEKSQQNIDAKQKEIDGSYNQLRKRLRAIYMAGDTSNLEVLLGAADVNDFIDKAYLVKNIAQHDQTLIDTLNDDLSSLKSEKTSLTNAKDEQQLQQESLTKKTDELSVLQTESDSLIAKLEGQQSDLEADSEKVQAEQDALSQELSKLQIKRAAQQAAEEQAKQQSQSGNVNTITPQSNGERTGQKYIMPAPECTVITAYWGDGRNHKGIDFACNGSAYGKPIVAVAEGVVVVANSTDNWGSGWGFHVMIDHGGGYYTQYAHCSTVAVKVGQTVNQGDIIGYVGSTGDSSGPHLHFECWYMGERYDPSTELF